MKILARFASLLVLALTTACATLNVPSASELSGVMAPSSPPGAPHAGSLAIINWSGDLAGSNNRTQTVAGIKGITVPTPTGANTVLTYNLGAFSWGAGGGGSVTWANDLAGSTSTNQYVAAISGSGGLGGTIPINASALQAGTAISAFTLGTNKAGATLTLQADASTNVVQFAGGTQDSLALGTNLATSGHVRWPNAIAIDGRTAANSANATLIHWDASNDLIIGDQTNVGATRLWAASSTGLQTGGGDYLIVNPGAYDFNGAITVTPTAGAASIVPTSGTMTIGGTATANSYAGAAQYSTRTVTASFTVDTTTTDNHICADTTSAAFTITLPAPTNGRRIELINCGFSGGSTGWALHNLTIARHGTENINGVSINKLLTGAGQPVCEIESPNGTNWFTNCQ